MAPSFAALLKQHLDARSMNPHGFAVRVGMAPTFVYQILSGKRPAPTKHLAAMVRELALSGADLYDFLVLAALSHVPTELRSMIAAADPGSSARRNAATLIDHARTISGRAKPKKRAQSPS